MRKNGTADPIIRPKYPFVVNTSLIRSNEITILLTALNNDTLTKF
jgi:hypothetical protein